MPSILEAGTKATLDSVAKNKLRAEADLASGRIDGSISTIRKGLTLTAYVSALIKGPQKTVAAGVRVERDF